MPYLLSLFRKFCTAKLTGALYILFYRAIFICPFASLEEILDAGAGGVVVGGLLSLPGNYTNVYGKADVVYL